MSSNAPVPGTSTYDQVNAVFSGLGVPDWIWYPISILESGGNPSSVHMDTNGYNSVGLFQLNMAPPTAPGGPGQGYGYTIAQLQDPVENATIAAKPIADAWNSALSSMPGASRDELLVFVADNSGHAGLNSYSLSSAQLDFLGNGPSKTFGSLTESVTQFGVAAAAGYNPFDIVGNNPFDIVGNFEAWWNAQNWQRFAVLLIGLALVGIALAAFAFKPATQVVGEVAKVAAA
jgi:Transglycosylase SLT domain